MHRKEALEEVVQGLGEGASGAARPQTPAGQLYQGFRGAGPMQGAASDSV